MEKKLTIPLRSALIEYRDTPKTCAGKPIPIGAVRRILQYDDKLRYGRIASRNRCAEADYFPALSSYGELKQEVVRYASWYSESWSTRGKPVCRIAREDNAGRTVNFSPLKKSALLGPNAMDVLRRMLIPQNASFYLAHVLVANRVHFGYHLRGAKNPPECANPSERPNLARDKITDGNSGSSLSGSDGDAPSCSDEETADSIARDE